MKPIIFIMGSPNTGKTTLARQLAPGEQRIHMDNVCISLAIKRPDLLPTEIPADDMPDIDLTINLIGKIHAFCAHLSELNLNHLLVVEYRSIEAARSREVKVVEGYALGAVLSEMETAQVGREVIKVWTDREAVVIDGSSFSLTDATALLKRRLHPVKYS